MLKVLFTLQELLGVDADGFVQGVFETAVFESANYVLHRLESDVVVFIFSKTDSYNFIIRISIKYEITYPINFCSSVIKQQEFSVSCSINLKNYAFIQALIRKIRSKSHEIIIKNKTHNLPSKHPNSSS